ncbi:hypothetical protein BS47DRAFT_1490470 [Hydnum rufescens UP504]|uniref:Uncharacterized protein n=1 Tax=Hydnum rufescens UP504 TaxID=1448309 RepID=A0A9P6ADN8_9AGAM|nr:hypothetical protein BS47DRAFT_1490470 [Hydnum rufescens UP504]
MLVPADVLLASSSVLRSYSLLAPGSQPRLTPQLPFLSIVLSIMSPSFFFHGDEGVLPFQALIFPPSFFAAPHRTLVLSSTSHAKYFLIVLWLHSMESNLYQSVSGLSFCEKAQWTWLPVSGYRLSGSRSVFLLWNFLAAN